MRRWIPFVLAAIGLAYVANAVVVSGPHPSNGLPIRPYLLFGVVDTAFAAGECAGFGFTSANGAVCATNATSRVVLDHDFVITEVAVVVGAETFATHEACDVDLIVESPSGAAAAIPSGIVSFEVGGATVGRTAGSSDHQQVHVVLSAGDEVQVQHTAPLTQYCADTVGCVCDATVSGSYWYRVYGDVISD